MRDAQTCVSTLRDAHAIQLKIVELSIYWAANLTLITTEPNPYQYVEKDPETVIPVLKGLIHFWPWSCRLGIHTVRIK